MAPDMENNCFEYNKYKCNYLRSLSLGFFYYYLHQSWDINIHKYSTYCEHALTMCLVFLILVYNIKYLNCFSTGTGAEEPMVLVLLSTPTRSASGERMLPKKVYLPGRLKGQCYEKRD